MCCSPWDHKESDTTERLNWTVAYQAPPSMGFSRQECWSELPFPSPGDLPNPGIFPTQGLNLGLLHCRWILYHLSHQRSPQFLVSYLFYTYCQQCRQLFKHALQESCKLSFIGGKMRTAAWETAPQFSSVQSLSHVRLPATP